MDMVVCSEDVKCVESICCDGQEADYRLQDAYSFTNVDYSVTGTIDNQFDIDIQKYEIKI